MANKYGFFLKGLALMFGKASISGALLAAFAVCALVSRSDEVRGDDKEDIRTRIAIAPYDYESPEWYCVNWSRDEWDVSLSGDQSEMLITKRTIGEQRPVLHYDDDGLLVAFDRGEFGAVIWWVPSTGKEPSLVSREHLLAFVSTRRGLFGVTGYSHLTKSEGKILQFIKLPEKKWTVVPTLDLGSAARAIFRTAEDELLIAAHVGLLKVRLPDQRVLLHKSRGVYTLAPKSLVQDKSGVIFLGMRHAIARLTPTDQGYREEWLVPKTCPLLKQTTKTFVCECVVPDQK